MSARILKAREAAGMTQEQVAQGLGLTRGSIGQWESDKAETYPSLKHLAALAVLLDVSFEWLAVERGSMFAHHQKVAEPKAPYGEVAESAEEMRLLKAFRNFSDGGRAAIFAVADALLEKQKGT